MFISTILFWLSKFLNIEQSTRYVHYSSKHVGQWVMLDLGLLWYMDADQFNFIRQVHPDIWDTHDSRNGCWRSRLSLC